MSIHEYVIRRAERSQQRCNLKYDEYSTSYLPYSIDYYSPEIQLWSSPTKTITSEFPVYCYRKMIINETIIFQLFTWLIISNGLINFLERNKTSVLSSPKQNTKII